MNLRFTFIVVLVAVALGVFAYTLRDTEPRQVGPGAATATPQPILDLVEAEIQEVGVVGATSAYTLSRVAGGWQVDGQAANYEVGSVVTTLAKPSVLRVLPEDLKPENYGFATPELTVTLRMQAGESHVILVGDKAVAEEQRYIRLASGGPMVLVSNYDFQSLIDWLSDPPLAPTATPIDVLTPGAGEALETVITSTPGIEQTVESPGAETAELSSTEVFTPTVAASPIVTAPPPVTTRPATSRPMASATAPPAAPATAKP